MRLPRVQFRIRLMMITIVLASLVFAGISAYLERQRRVVALQMAEADLTLSALTREVAEIAIVEYKQRRYKHDLAAVEAEISQAELELKAAEDISDEQAVERAKSVLERARNNRATLEKGTKDQTIKALEDEVQKAKRTNRPGGQHFSRRKGPWRGGCGRRVRVGALAAPFPLAPFPLPDGPGPVKPAQQVQGPGYPPPAGLRATSWISTRS
jgi:hypothetical protein